MNIPVAAAQNFEAFKTRGTLGAGAERYQISLEASSTLDAMSQSIDDTVALDNQEGIDSNPKPGDLLLEDPDFTKEVVVQGDSRQGQLTEVAQAKAHNLQSVIFMETSEDKFVSYQAYLDKSGAMTHAWAYQVDRHNPLKTFAESLTVQH